MAIRLLTMLVLVAAGLTLVGCNTVEGVGKDIQSLGQAMQDAAN